MSRLHVRNCLLIRTDPIRTYHPYDIQFSMYNLHAVLLSAYVINIPAEVKHWHGAAPDSWFSHLAIEVAGEETSNEWLETVSDEE